MNLSNIYYLHEIGGKKNQEDYIWPVPGKASLHDKVFIVCDGVGGSENGEIASRMIAEYVGKAILLMPETQISVDTINRLLEEAKQALLAHAHAMGFNKDMATTFCILVLFSNRALVAWCGDSRMYQVRNGAILYKTSDHSLVNTLVKNGEITEEEAFTHPQKHIILKAINGDAGPVEAEGEWITDIASGDYFLLCTDGLLENIGDTDIKNLLNQNRTGKNDIITAIQQRCLGKTRDNYSLYLVQTTVADIPTPPPASKKSAAPWLLLLLIALLAGSFFIFTKSKPAAGDIPAVAPTASRPAAVTHDSAPSTAKDSLPYTELEIPKTVEEKKITPVPLPEKNGSAPGAGIPKGKDTVQLNLSTLQKNKKVADTTGSKQ